MISGEVRRAAGCMSGCSEGTHPFAEWVCPPEQPDIQVVSPDFTAVY